MFPDQNTSRRVTARTRGAITALKLLRPIVLACAWATAWAEQSPMALCRAIEDPGERVACYDAVLDAEAGITETVSEPVQRPGVTESVAAPAEVPVAEPAPAPAREPTSPVTTTPEPVAESSQPIAPVTIPDTSSPAVATEPPQATSGSNEADFGLPAERPAKEVDEISVAVSSVKRSPLGRLVLELGNGQTWAQVDSRKLNVRQGDTVNIRAGLGGSFYLTKATGSRSLKVRRLN